MVSGWATHSHAPRRSHDQSVHSTKRSRSSSPDPESPRRSSIDATPRQTPATTRFLSSPAANDQDTDRSVLNPAPEVFSSSKRLGFFADKLTSSHSGLKGSLHASQLLHPHIHTRNDSNQAPSSSAAPLPTMATASSISSMSKSHTSPSKASYGRTYDSKLVSREMHRLGSLAHLPSALAPPITTAPSVSSLPAPGSQASLASASTSDPWGALHVHVLPLFNGEPLRIPIEDLNVLVKRHIQAVVSSSPSKALATLENDASELIASGMVTLNAKLMGIDDEKLVARVVEIWGFFWDQVLTYVEGVLLPLQTDSLLSSLYRTPKPHHRATSPGRQGTKGSVSSSLSNAIPASTSHIDVRSVALRSFRDKVILPLFSRLYMRLAMPNRQDNFQETSTYQQPRLQQMLLVLTSQRRPRPVAFSLTTPAPAPTAGEAAVADLLRIVRSPRSQYDSRMQAKLGGPMSPLSRAPSFLSGGLPRDRRGRIAHKTNGRGPPHLVGLGVPGEEDDRVGDETPRNGQTSFVVDVEREREREFLEALRSPELESNATRASVGGWGLGAGHEDVGKATEEEEEDEPLDWDQAQAVVERMVGMTSPPETRRRMT
ncbi:Target of rapamycin complex 2 subunit bit61 [Hypsizygus marmoreus]|uniref:Target of rapamycin complex 2 subunit bit61 n=1 Tax=Hypsizygus marmoreus TaxID=39966 RepID=A0A369JR08_HYPMA|nr:Target of rapamycin complex 2 subunit bit61 [Hypsizygus marmoreus]